MRRFIGCNHIRSYEFFTESFNSKCPFLSVQCGSWEEFLTGSCTCGANNCFYMGYKANLLPPGTAIYRPEMTKAYLMTGSVKPFCRELTSFAYSIHLKIRLIVPHEYAN